ncbi:methyltransferase [Streptomyces virginiae]|uniref:methyltransferase n=1 Tax=Streptomyces virginiae TaxID=1961 RepID=UPI0036EED6A9
MIALPGVYRPQADTALLARALVQEDLGPASEVLEIGTGTGEPALRSADTGAHVTAVDVSWLAVLTARLNALRRRIPLRVVHGDFAGRVADHRYDLVVSNPDLRGSTPPPAPRGRPAQGHSGLCGADQTVRRPAGEGLAAEVTARASVPWGPVLRARRDRLERKGRVAEAEQWEEPAVIRARYP